MEEIDRQMSDTIALKRQPPWLSALIPTAIFSAIDPVKSTGS